MSLFKKAKLLGRELTNGLAQTASKTPFGGKVLLLLEAIYILLAGQQDLLPRLIHTTRQVQLPGLYLQVLHRLLSKPGAVAVAVALVMVPVLVVRVVVVAMQKWCLPLLQGRACLYKLAMEAIGATIRGLPEMAVALVR
jgi:hypothetical protein